MKKYYIEKSINRINKYKKIKKINYEKILINLEIKSPPNL